MHEIWAAISGALASCLLMAVANVSTRRERDIAEIFGRLNAIEKAVARLEQAIKQNPR